MVDLQPNKNSIANHSYLVNDQYTFNLPSDCAWGIRTVHLFSINTLLLQIIGVNKIGNSAMIWINCYNINHWTGWKSL